jgi:hypothetical protein
MSESIKKIKVDRDVNVGVYFTNVNADLRTVRRIFQSEQPAGLKAVTGPWDKLYKEGEEAYGLAGNDNEIIELLEKIDDSYFRRKPLSTEYEFLNEEDSKKIIKGIKYSVKYENLVVDVNQINAKSFFKIEADIVSGSSAYTGVFFKKEKKEDYNVDISLIRSFDTLDTLSVKNNPLSEFPNQESDTGVVMGTLYARQKIVDENGERIKIPLANVPVVIFNESNKFPTLASTDDDGNRISLNFIENTNRLDFADEFSYVTDVGSNHAIKVLGKTKKGIESVNGILKNVNSLNIPEEYLYSTITNENGEFIIENVPVGQRTLMFEVDLLKQGMTKDEVQLNFFPYPTSSEPNVDSVPHFYFRQIPVGVSSSWGSFQSGYTQVDITASIDMRRWSTYYISPISRDEQNLSELLRGGNFETLNVLVKDMTREGYPLTNEVVEVLDIYSRDEAQRIGWFTENKTSKYQAQFREDGFKAFKLPANLYDPKGIPSGDSGRSTLSSKKGVWLSCYQMKMLYGGDVETVLYRATGFLRKAISTNADFQQKSSHFDINRGPGYGIKDATGEPPESSLNVFPYEKPWTIDYPNKYSIPSSPKNSQGKDYGIKLQPRFRDGDMPGLFIYPDEDDNIGHGYATMIGYDSNDWLYNRFGTVITRYRIYKYEQNSRWDDEWSNGFRPYYHQNSASSRDLNLSGSYEVKSGEKYQRVEAGFSYWLKPEGWGRIQSAAWGDFMLSSDINDKYSEPSEEFIPKSYLNIGAVYRDGEKIYLSLDGSLPNWLQGGALDIYRVIDDLPEDLIVPRPPEESRFVEIEIGDVLAANYLEKNDRTKLRMNPKKDGDVHFATAMKIEIENQGSVERSVNVGGVAKTIKPNEIQEFDISAGKIILQTNTEFDAIENFYGVCRYAFRCKTSEIPKSGERTSNYFYMNSSGVPKSETKTFYIRSTCYGVRGNVDFKKDGDDRVFNKCADKYDREGDYIINGILVEASGKSTVTMELTTTYTTPQCSQAGFGYYRIKNS